VVANVCGGRGHKGQDRATAKLSTPRPDDGTSKPKANVDREFTFRDSAGTTNRGTGKRGTARLKRRLSAEEWADLPFIEGTFTYPGPFWFIHRRRRKIFWRRSACNAISASRHLQNSTSWRLACGSDLVGASSLAAVKTSPKKMVVSAWH
jgi:hypothetical protein